jgi:hypothetical protein
VFPELSLQVTPGLFPLVFELSHASMTTSMSPTLADTSVISSVELLVVEVAVVTSETVKPTALPPV